MRLRDGQRREEQADSGSGGRPADAPGTPLIMQCAFSGGVKHTEVLEEGQSK
jgi:hypothetical protein